MRVLIIDDGGRSSAALVASTLRRLGHRAELASPEDAFGRVDRDRFDGAIVQASAAYPDLATLLRVAATELPVAVAGEDVAPGSAPPPLVLPRVWTVVDLRRVLDEIEHEHRRMARGSMPAEFELDDLADAAPVLDPVPPVAAPRPEPPRIDLSCGSWARVRRLCDDAVGDRVRIVVHGRRALEPGAAVTVLIALPDDLVLRFAASVVHREQEGRGRSASVLELVGVSPERLRALIPAD